MLGQQMPLGSAPPHPFVIIVAGLTVSHSPDKDWVAPCSRCNQPALIAGGKLEAALRDGHEGRLLAKKLDGSSTCADRS